MIFGPLFTAALLAAASLNPVSQGVSTSPGAGEPAPDFSYQSHDYLWQSLHNMLEHGSVLLVFGAGEADLRAIESEREALLRQGVLPVAVIEQREGDVWNIVRKADLSYSLLSDPHGAIAVQYGVFEPATRGARSSWFLIDASGSVRETGSGALHHDWARLAADALGRTAVRTASAH